MDNKAKVQRALVPPRPVRLNVNAEVPTPFVVPWTWYIKQRVFWPLPKLLCVTVTADGKQDEARYAALVHEDKQFGLRVSFNQTTALEKYAGYHLMSVGKVGQTQLHFTLSRSACPCSSGASGKGCTACGPSSGAAADAPNQKAPPSAAAGQAAEVAGRASGLEAAEAALLRAGFADGGVVAGAAARGVTGSVQGGAPSAGAAAATGIRRSGGGASASGTTGSAVSTATGTGGGEAAGVSSGAAATAGPRPEGVFSRRAALDSGSGGRRQAGRRRRHRAGSGGGGSGRRSSASGMSSGAGGDSGSEGGSSSSSSSDDDEAGGRAEPVPNNPFRKDYCSCPCHVWRQYWPDPDDHRRHQTDADELTLMDREARRADRGRSGISGGGRGRASGGRDGRGPQQARARSVDTDEEWQLGSGSRGRKRSASVEVEAEGGARAARRPRVANGSGPPPRSRPPVAPAATAAQPSVGSPAEGAVDGALRQPPQVRRGSASSALPPLPPAPAAVAAPLPREAAMPPREERQDTGRQSLLQQQPPQQQPSQQQPPPYPQPQQHKQPQQPQRRHQPLLEQTRPAQPQQPPPRQLQEEEEQAQTEPQPRGSSSEPDGAGSGNGAAAAAEGGLLAHAPPGDHVSIEDGGGHHADSPEDGADQLDSPLPPPPLAQQQQQQTRSEGPGPRAASGCDSRPGPSCGGIGVGGLGPSALSPSPKSQTLPSQPQATREVATVGASGAGAKPQQEQEGHFMVSAAEAAKRRRVELGMESAKPGAGSRAVAEQQPKPQSPPKPVMVSVAEQAKLRRANAVIVKARQHSAAAAATGGSAYTTTSPERRRLHHGRRSGHRLSKQQGDHACVQPLQPQQQLLRPLQLNEPVRQAPKDAVPTKATAQGSAARTGGTAHPQSELLVSRQAVAIVKPRHKRSREDEPPVGGVAAASAEPAPVRLLPVPSGAAAAAPARPQLPRCGGSGSLPQEQPQQQLAVGAAQLRAAPPPGAAAAGGAGGGAAKGAGEAEPLPPPPPLLAPPGRPICRPAWGVKPLECGSTRPRVGALISGPKLSVDSSILRGDRGRGPCFLRLFVEIDGFVDGHMAAKCVRVEDAGRTATFTNVPSHAQGCTFLGWGVLPGGSLVLRVQSAAPTEAAAAAAPASAAALERQRQWSRAAAAGAAVAKSLDRRRCRGAFRSPATQEAAAAAAAAAGQPEGGASGAAPGPRPRKMVRVGELLRRAPVVPSQL